MSKALHGRVFVFAAVIAAAGVPFCRAEPPKNIVFCIGDGMGFNNVKAARYYVGTNLCFENFPNQSTVMTYSANNPITDSAASGTAMATGYKVDNGVISIAQPGDGHSYQTILEFLKMRGKATAIITTDLITDATPGTYGAHVSSRTMYSQIASHYLTNSRPNVVFGGGDASLNETSSTNAGYAYVTNAAALAAVDATNEFVMGSFGMGALPYVYVGRGALPGLTNMVEKALDILSLDPDGFFMMMECSGNDDMSHANNITGMVKEVAEFDRSVQRVLDWASNRNDTLVIVTADHETGGLTNVADNGVGNVPSGTWTTGGHTSSRVPAYGWGPGSEFISGVTNNTDYFPALTAMFVRSNTVATVPAGLVVTVDGIAAATPYTFLCRGTSAVMRAASPQTNTAGDIRYVFGVWTNEVSGMASTNNPFAFAVTGHTNWTAVFDPQYRQSFAVWPSGGGDVAPSLPLWASGGDSITVTAVAVEGFTFMGWRDGTNDGMVSTDNPYGYAVDGVRLLTGVFDPTGIGVTVEARPFTNLVFDVDGALYTNTWTFNWNVGSVHTVAVSQTMQAIGPGTRYVWTNWTDGGATSHVFTVVEADDGRVLAAEFYVEYQWAGSASPVSGGQVSPAIGWYPAGTVLPVVATQNQSYQFVSWSGDAAGTNPSVEVAMGGPRSAVARFSRIWFAATNGNVSAATGTAWTNALALTNVLGRAGDGDEVWVKAGVYYPAPGSARARLFAVKSGVRLYGGFSGAESNVDGRNWTQYVTRLSGDIGTRQVATDNSSRVIDVATNAVVDGFFISDGYNTNTAGNWAHGPATIRHCVFENNVALTGAGLYVSGNVMLLNCIWRGNQAEDDGGGIAIISGTPVVENGLFGHNQAQIGGAIAAAGGVMYFFHCTFYSNLAAEAAGVYLYDLASPRFANCIFWDEGGDGGGISLMRYNGTIGAGLMDVRSCVVRGGLAAPAEYLGVVTNVIDQDPLFVDAAGGRFELQPKSPCIDQGENLSMQMADDLAGSPRLSGRLPDMGAYEAPSVIPSGWWSQFGLPAGGDAGDPDDDGYDNLAEYIAGTDPTNGLSMFAIVNVRQTETLDLVMEWPSLTGREYTVYFAPAWTSDFAPATNHLRAEPPLNAFTNGADRGSNGFYRVSVSLQ
jgi:alkaline phosphatase